MNESSVFRHLTVALHALAEDPRVSKREGTLNNPDEAVAFGAAAQAATHHRAKRGLNTQRAQAKRTLSPSLPDVFS